MRAFLLAVLVFVFAGSISSVSALPLAEGKIVRGSYVAQGSIKTVGFRTQYGPSTVHVTINGRLRGKVVRTSQFAGVTVTNVVSISGKVRSVHLRARKGTFTAPAVIRIGGNAAFRGEFTGLFDQSQKLSRFFRGKINRAHSNLTLRAK